MIKPAIPKNEKQRVKALVEYEVLDTVPEQNFDDLTKIAAQICGVPISLISLVDSSRQWFKSHHGIDATETPRDLAFCAHAINKPDEVLIVNDASKDERFFDNPLAMNEPNVVFYAGAPLVNSKGYALGTLCVIDHEPRTLSDGQKEALQALARQVMSQMEYRKEIHKRKRENQFIAKTSDLMELMIESAPTGMLMADEHGSIVLANSLIDELFGYSREELIGSRIETLIPSRFKNDHENYRTGFFHSPEKRSMGSGRELFGLKKDGTEIPIEIGLNPINTPQGSFVLSSVIDITERMLAEREIKQFAKFFTMSLNLVCVAGTDGYFKKLNPAFSDVLGWSEEELYSKPFISFVHPDDISSTKKEIEKLGKGMLTIGFQNRWLCKDGSIRFLDWTATPDPETGELFAVAYDLTELNSTQEKLNRLTLNYQGQLEAIDRSAAKVELDMNGTIIDTNKNFRNLLEYTEEELHQQHHSILLDADYAESNRYKTFWKELREGKYIAGEFKRTSKSGETVWINGSYNPVIDASGKPYKVIKIAYNISDKKKTEALLAESNTLKSAILDNNNFSIISTDKDGLIKSFNKTAEQQLGYNAEELINKQSPAILHDLNEVVERTKVLNKELKNKIEPGFTTFVAKCVELGEPDENEWTYVRKDGSRYPVALSVSSLTDAEGEIFGFLGIGQDISEKKNAQRQILEYSQSLEDKNKELDQFAYVVSHDLKAPLRGISTVATFLAEDYADVLDEDGNEQIDLLLGRIDRMNNLITGILDYSRIGRSKLEKEEVDLAEMLHVVADLIVPKTFKVSVSKNFPTLSIERVLIEQIFQNLISNAVKYNDKEPGKGVIEIICKDEVDNWKFSISDNGPGIEEQYFERIFKIFQTLNSRDTIESTGIGLSLVKKTIDIWGGEIWVESKYGQGSRFIFTIPK